ncbi:MAG TPA: glycosyltransferase family 2 protein [Patescibacteria group bacterium]|nr:glycosyltransferase family 2 protein [Patescibacteria group bacterium]
MNPKLTTKQRIEAINRVIKDKEAVNKVCNELGISRTIFYLWLNKYKKYGGEAITVGKRIKNIEKKSDVENKILDIIKEKPSYSSKKISKEMGIDNYGKKILGNHGVQNILEKNKLSRVDERLIFAKEKDRRIREEEKRILSANEKLKMIERNIIGGEEVSNLSKEYGVSRTLFYKLKKRYEKAGLEDKIKSLQPRIPEVTRWWRQTPEKYEQAILSIIAKHPEYGIRNIVKNLPRFGEVPIVGHHGVQNVLRRFDLSNYEQRLVYAKAQVSPVTQTIAGTVQVASRFFNIPEILRHRLIRFAGTFALSTFITIAVFGLGSYVARSFTQVSGGSTIGMVFASLALLMGSIFFLYSFKYYLTLAIVLSFSQQEASLSINGKGNGKKKGLISWILGMTGGNGNGNGKNHTGPVGLEPNLEHISLKRYPYFSIQIPFYNEKNVVERAIAAATNFDYKGDYEVILCDDSTDETTQIIRNYQKRYLAKGEDLREVNGNGWTLTAVEVSPGVILKHLHRTSRSGFKGGALKLALKLVNPKTEFISVFDADFVPYPDTLELFLKYFEVQNNMSEDYKKTNVAAVAGYQWHVLNKSENWITRGVRTEYSGSYVIERSGTEIYGGMKLIHGSVYAIRKDALEAVGWDTSITEDFELTLKLYDAGYKVVYTPYIQAPAECVSTLKRLIRQRMRWAEGHSHNVRKMFKHLLLNPKLTPVEKLEFLYLSPYYLQAFFFLVGTFSWLLSETVFPARLPFWTSLWGWSLVLTNLFALPLMNAVGLFLEESEERDYLGIASFVALSYIMVPFQAYASIKGFIEKEEGPWFRTPKTGRITDVFTRGRFYRFISGILPGKTPATAGAELSSISSQYLALSTANNQFNNFTIKSRKNRWVSKLILSILLILSVTTYSATKGVPEVLANPAISSTQYLRTGTTATLTNSRVLGETLDTGNTVTATVVAPKGSALARYQYRPGGSGLYSEPTCANGAATGYGWILDVPFQANGTIDSGAWSFTFYESDGVNAQANGTLQVCVYKITVNGGAIVGSTLLFNTGSDGGWPLTDIIGYNVNNTTYTTSSMSSFTLTTDEYLFVQYSLNLTGSAQATTSVFTGGDVGGTVDPMVVMPTVTVPENVLLFIIVSPLIPYMVIWFKKRRLASCV